MDRSRRCWQSRDGILVEMTVDEMIPNLMEKVASISRAIEENVTVPLANALSEAEKNCRCSFRIGVEQSNIQVHAEKLEVKTESDKQHELAVVNSWQTLGAMARRARVSGPLRELENDLERNRRMTVLLEKKLKSAQGPRRIAGIRQDLAEAKAHLESGRKLQQQIGEVAQQISDHHLRIMLDWYRNQSINWNESANLARQQRSLLRQAVENILAGRIHEGNLISLLVIGRTLGIYGTILCVKVCVCV